MIRAVRGYFSSTPQFKDFDKPTRRKIAGLNTTPDIFFKWFGSMKGGGHFQSAINRTSSGLSDALDAIPSLGEVTRADFIEYSRLFNCTFREVLDPAA